MRDLDKSNGSILPGHAQVNLEAARARIDEYDEGLLMFLVGRVRVVRDEVAPAKKELGLDAYQHDRYTEKMGQLAARAAELGLDPGMVLNIWGAIHEDSLAQQDQQLRPNPEV